MIIGPSGQGPYQNAEMRAAINRRIREPDNYRVILVLEARDRGVKAVAFTTKWQELSNSFPVYVAEISKSNTDSLTLVAAGLFGPEGEVRQLAKRFSLFK